MIQILLNPLKNGPVKRKYTEMFLKLCPFTWFCYSNTLIFIIAEGEYVKVILVWSSHSKDNKESDL